MNLRTASRYVLSALFVTAGVMHFRKPRWFMKIVPPVIPQPKTVVYVSGALEIAGGLGLLCPPHRSKAADGLVALLLAVFPANLYMAFGPVKFGGVVDTPLFHAMRLPMQFVLMRWVKWATADSGVSL